MKSFVLGLVIGVAVQLSAPADAGFADRVLTVLACGAVGLLIGAATDRLTSLVPIRFARPAVYFLVNNLIAVVVSAVVTASLVALTAADGPPWLFLLYRRAQRRLHAVQAELALERDGDPVVAEP